MSSVDAQAAAGSGTYSKRWWTLSIVSVTVLIATIDETIVNVALPSLQRDLGASASALQWIVNSYVLVFAGWQLIAHDSNVADDTSEPWDGRGLVSPAHIHARSPDARLRLPDRLDAPAEAGFSLDIQVD